MRKANDSERAVPGLQSSTVVVFAGGERVPGDLARLVPAGATVIAADSGLYAATENGVDVHIAIGDFDSVDDASLHRAEASGTKVERFPPTKDETDLELALRRATALEAEHIVVIGGHGGRTDHFIANAMLLAADDHRQASVEAYFGHARAYVVRSTVAIDGEVGDLLTLLPVHGPARGVTTDGLLYPLQNATLHPGSTRGVSNQFVEPVASVHVEGGVLLAITPGERNTPCTPT